MRQVALDADATQRLGQMLQIVALSDPMGYVLGRFVPRNGLSELEFLGMEIIVDTYLAERLRDLYQTAKLCDPVGKTIGSFVPKNNLPELEILGPDISDVQMNSSEKRYTLAEVLAHLEKL